MANTKAPTKPPQHDPLDDALSDSFPASDPVAAESPTITGESVVADPRPKPDLPRRSPSERSRKA